MKTRILSILLAIMMILSIFALSACDLGSIEGPEGPQGEQGEPGKDGQDGVGIKGITLVKSTGLVDTYLITYTNGATSTFTVTNGEDGQDGVNGAPGQDGADGKDGKDGVGIASVEVNADGELVLIFTNGTSLNLGRVVGSDGKDGADGEDGKDGVDGAPGQDGADGKDGKDGVGIAGVEIVDGKLVITLSNGSTIDLGNIKGEDGKDGVDGEDGKDGVDGKPGQDGADGKDGINGKDGISIVKSEINANGELVLTYSDGTSINLGRVVGTDGKDGADGEDGKDGVDGKPGQDGVDGKPGQDGADGKDGVDGIGISSVVINEKHELVVTLTNGTVINLGNIKGDKGEDGKNGQNGISIVKSEINANGELVLTYSDGTSINLGRVVGNDGKDGADGEDGEDGKDGADGKDGVDGIGISSVVINEKHELVVTLTNGTVINLGNIKGDKGDNGQDGVSIVKSEINANGELVLTYSNGVTVNLGKVVGADGKDGIDGEDGTPGQDGAPGEDGKDGVGIEKIEFDENGDLLVTFTDGKTETVKMPEKAEHVHTYGAWHLYGEDTRNCENNIYYTVCSECNHVELTKGDSERHVWRTVYSSDASYHWYKCANCDAVKDRVAHEYDNACDTDCNICGADRTAYAHVYDEGVCDVDCNVCGAVRTNPHLWDNACDAECDRCGETRDVPDHVYNNACDADCNVCGGTRVPADHVYDDEFDAVCNVCSARRDVPYTWALEYALTPDEDAYMVIGIGEATDTVITIPETHNGLPVTMIRARAFYQCYNITSVIIPESVIAIGGYAFFDCDRLTEIVIPDSVTLLGEGAFQHCSVLKSAIIGNGVEAIGSHAFNNCSNLESVVIGNSVETIGSYVFAYCYKLESIIIPDSVTTIASDAFVSCSALKEVTIGAGVTSIDSSAFNGCTALINFTVSEDNQTHKSMDGNLYSKDGKTLVRYAIGKKNASFTVPESVEVIYKYAFRDSANLVRVIIQGNLKTVNYAAFYNCYSLMDVCYTGSEAEWKKVYIDSDNTSLTNARFNYNWCIHEYSGDCDAECDKCGEARTPKAEHSEETIDAVAPTCTTTGLTEGKKCSVCNVVLVAQEIIPAQHNFVGGVCQYCGELSLDCFELTLRSDNTYSIKAKAGATLPTSVIIPSTYKNLPVTEIAENGFASVSGMTSITIPASITRIGNNAFKDCEDLTIYCEVKTQPKTWSENWNPDNRPVIWQYINVTPASEFLWTSDGECITLTGYIGNRANVVTPAFINGLPVKHITSRAFDYSTFTSFYISEGVLTIGDSAFSDCTNMCSVHLPSTLKSLGTCAFAYCTNLRAVELPDSLETIGTWVFMVCENLHAVVVPESITSMNQTNFYNSNNVTVYSKSEDFYVYSYFDRVINNYNPTDFNDFDYTVYSSYVYINGYIGNEANIVIPAIIEDLPVIVINGFDTNKHLESLTILDGSVEEIWNEGFQYCSIENIYLGDSVTYLTNEDAFSHCYNLKNIIVSENNTAFKSIDGNLYSKDGKALIQYAIGKNEKEFTIPYGVTRIGDYAFYCANLTSVEIPDTVVHIGVNAFEDSSIKYIEYNDAYYMGTSDNPYAILFSAKSTDITNIIIHNDTKFIANDAFYECENLTSIVLPESVISIGEYAFSGCTNLTNIVIPDSIMGVGNNAFIRCKSLTFNQYDNAYYLGNENNPYMVLISQIHSDITSCEIHPETKVIAESAFDYNWSLTEITIPESVISVGSNAFGCGYSLTIYCEAYSEPELWDANWNSINSPVVWNCLYDDIATDGARYTIINGVRYAIQNGKAKVVRNGDEIVTAEILSSIVYKGTTYRVTEIGEGAFIGCRELISVTIPEGITSIGNLAFYAAEKLESIVIPDSVTSIGDEAFCDYYGGGSLKSIVIGSGLTNIGDAAFYAATKRLASFTVLEDNKAFKSIDGHLYSKDGKTLICYAGGQLNTEFVIPDTVTKIAGYSFSGADNLLKVVIPDTVKTIEEWAFVGMNNATIYCEAETQPIGWHNEWKSNHQLAVWGYKEVLAD